jgi:transposase-like protein
METPTDSPVGAIVKSDRTGRTRYTAQYKREVLDAFESSSLSAPVFARQCGVKYPTFAAWITARRRGSSPGPSGKPSGPPAFLLAEIGDASSGAVLEVRLPGGAVARAAGPCQLKQLAELLRLLA